MRKIGLILLRDIIKNRNSAIRNEFCSYLDERTIKIIKYHFEKNNEDAPRPDDDINISLDQTKRLIMAINGGLEYPKLINEKVDYNDLKNFLHKLSSIFKWSHYEKDTIGNGNSIDYYATILSSWMNGNGLKQIIDNTLKYHKNNYKEIKIHGNSHIYNDSPLHRNTVIGDTLSIIESVILFSIANYFLKFSTEYKRLTNNGLPFENDWYEYIEFGSTNELTIFFQRNGLSRDTSDYIREHKNKYVIKQNKAYKLKKQLLSCGKKSIENELKDILYNVPDLFINE